MTALQHGDRRGGADRRWLLMAVPAFITALLVAGPYVTFSFTRLPLSDSAPLHILFLSLHGVSSGAALLLGPFQFVRRIRVHHPGVHRTIGTLYLLAVLVGAVMALASAIVSESGFSAQVGFLILDAFWIYTAARALQAVLARDFAWHRIWMIRNYSATFAAVLLRVILILEMTVLPRFGIEPSASSAYDVAVWGSITPSILGAELFVVQRSISPVLAPGMLPARDTA